MEFRTHIKGRKPGKLYVGKAGKMKEKGKEGKTGLEGKTTDQFLYMFTDLYSRLLN